MRIANECVLLLFRFYDVFGIEVTETIATFALIFLFGDFHVGSTGNATKRMKPEACLCMQISNHMQVLQGTGGFLGSRRL